MSKLAVLSAVALACAVAVQERCRVHDAAESSCETSGGSPLVSDCVEALKRLSGQCVQSNGGHSYCKTEVAYYTCKIDVCGEPAARIADGVNCGGYLQTILNDCQSGGRVGGYLAPADCNVQTASQGPSPTDSSYQGYRLQFSHT
ncbi:hypothetical protein C8Q80DRAFT_1343997 [Daedaleopsis nitida]|nr:hypothetical protein C8Q80DRAFT_1343997 [Daedaleopsis nitida]